MVDTENTPEPDDGPRVDVEMSDAEIVDVLRCAGYGVLSLADDGTAYSLPMSYGVDGDADALVFQFVSYDGSEKRAFVERTDAASFAVNCPRDGELWSVVVTGPIAPVSADDVPEAYAAIADSAWFPDTTVFDGPLTEADLELFELSVESATGRKAHGFDV